MPSESAIALPAVRTHAASAALARVAHAGVVVHAATLSVSLSITQIALGAALGAVLLAWAAGDRPFARAPIVVPVLVLTGVAALSVPVAWATGIPPVSLFRATLWKTFLSPLVVLWALALPVPGEDADAPRRRALAALGAWAASALLVGAVAAVQPWTGFDPLYAIGLRDHALRVTAERAAWPDHFHAVGFFGWYALLPQTLIPPLALALALALAAPVPRRLRVLLAAAAVAAAAASLLSLTRVAWIGLGAVLAVLVAGAGLRRARAVAAAAVAAAAIAALVPGIRQRLAGGVTLQANADRELIWRVCADVLRDHPAGVGVGNFGAVAGPYFDRLAPWFVARAGCHDAPLMFLVEGGAPLALAAAAYWLLLARAFLRARRAGDALGRAAALGGLAALAGAFANGLFHDTFQSSDVAYAMGFPIAAAWVIARRDRGLAPSPSPAPPAGKRGRAPVTEAGTAGARSPT